MDPTNFLKRNQDAFTAAAFAMVLGGITKFAFKREVIPVNTFGKALLSFTVISAAGIGANELKTKYPIGG